jgi:hypothetical protein
MRFMGAGVGRMGANGRCIAISRGRAEVKAAVSHLGPAKGHNIGRSPQANAPRAEQGIDVSCSLDLLWQTHGEVSPCPERAPVTDYQEVGKALS